MRLVDLHQGAGNGKSQCAGLAGEPAAFNLGDDVEAFGVGPWGGRREAQEGLTMLQMRRGAAAESNRITA